MNLTQMIARRAAAMTELQTAVNGGDMETVRSLTAEIATLNTDIDSVETAQRAIDSAAQTAPKAPVAPVATRALTPGEEVARSTQFTDFNGHGKSARVVVSAERALDAADVSTGTVAPLERPRHSGLVANLPRPLRVRDLFDNQKTDSFSGEYVVEVPKTNKAGWVAEGNSKPLQDFEFETRTSTLKTVAAGAVLTRQAAASPARIAGTINGRLGYNLDEVIDVDLLTGDGIGKPLGLYNLEGRNFHVAVAGTAADGAKIVVAIRKGMTKTLTNGKIPVDSIVMHPEDWETVELTRANGDTGTFILTPNLRDGDGNARLWGKTVIETSANPKGKVLLGAFRQSTVWARGDIAYYMTDSHEGFFLENKLVLLAETEIAPEHYRPSVYTEVTLTA